MRGKLSQITPDTDEIVAHVHMTFGKKYTAVFYLDEDKEVVDMEIFQTARQHPSKKKAGTLSLNVFHSMYENLMDIAFPQRSKGK